MPVMKVNIVDSEQNIGALSKDSKEDRLTELSG